MTRSHSTLSWVFFVLAYSHIFSTQSLSAMEEQSFGCALQFAHSDRHSRMRSATR